MSSETRKGQFFIIGALFICVLLFFGISPTIQITASPADDIGMLAENLEKEMPHALNIGINASDPLNVLYNFTDFSGDIMSGRGIDLDTLWVVFMPLDQSVNVSAGNFMDTPKTIGLNVSGTYKELYVGTGSVNSSVFGVTSYNYDTTMNIDGEETMITLLLNKTSIYSVISLERDGNIVRKELLA